MFSERELVDLSYGVIAINAWNRLSIAFRSEAGSYRVGMYGSAMPTSEFGVANAAVGALATTHRGNLNVKPAPMAACARRSGAASRRVTAVDTSSPPSRLRRVRNGDAAQAIAASIAFTAPLVIAHAVARTSVGTAVAAGALMAGSASRTGPSTRGLAQKIVPIVVAAILAGAIPDRGWFSAALVVLLASTRR